MNSNRVGVDKYFTIIWHLLQEHMIFYFWLPSTVNLHPLGPIKMGEPFIDFPCDNVNKRAININEQ